MLQTRDLKFSYEKGNYIEFPNIDCKQGEHWLLLGKSGSGKTTLLQLLGGLRTSQTGEVKVAGTVLNQLAGSQLDAFRGKNIGIIFQQSHFVRSLNVMENLLLAQQLAGVKPSKDRAKELLERLNLGNKAKSKTYELSQGEQQRVAIARALMNKPKIILADEPTSALDDQNCKEVIQLLETQANKENATLLIVTHDGRLKSEFENSITIGQA